MALPSQGSRVGMASGGRGGRRKKGGLGVVPVVFFLTLLGGAYGLYAYATSDGLGLLGDGSEPSDQNEQSEFAGGRAEATDESGWPGGPERESTTGRPTVTIASKQQPTDPVRGLSEDDGATSGAAREPQGTAGSDERPVQQQSATRAQPVSRLNASSPAVAAMLQRAERATRDGDLVEARRLLSDAILSGTLQGADAERARADAALINEDLVFTPRAVAGDRVSYEYFVGSGDTLSRIAKNEELETDWRLIQRVNQLVDPSRLRLGQKLKLVRGPFHAIVDKSSYRLDLFQGPRDTPDDWLYIRSFNVGLGEFDGTPLGEFVVREDSKLINPRWPNPRTGEIFEADDPMNPIGEHWIGLRGLGDAAVATGYGIHGTIDPDSIGGQESMGCIRMLPEDVGLVYELLMEDASLVVVRE